TRWMALPAGVRPGTNPWGEHMKRARAAILLALALAAASRPVSVSAQLVDANLWVTNGRVNAVARNGSVIYIGGSFTQVRPATGSGVPIDAVSGNPQPGFPKVVGAVLAAAPDGAGGWFIGGQFSLVGGLARSNLAHIASDLTVAAWNPNANDVVHAIA